MCSYGEQQRIAIVRALIQPFELLLMDEPFSHLDNENILKAAKLIAEECAKRNAGFVLTDLDEDEHFEYSFEVEFMNRHTCEGQVSHKFILVLLWEIPAFAGMTQKEMLVLC